MRNLSALLLATTLLPGIAAAEPFSGPYLGAQAGYERYQVDDRFTGAGALAGTNLSSDFTAAGVNGGLFAGYGKQFGKLYLGVEAEASLGNAGKKWTDTGVSSEVEHRFTYGASLRAGVMVTERTLAYGRLGVVRSRFDYDVAAPAIPFTQSGSKTLTGLRLGLGAERVLTERLTGRLDWGYTRYQDTSIDYILTGTGNIGTEKLDPSAHTIRVGLAYNF